MSSRVGLAFMLLCSIGAACSGPAGATCATDAECASGFCKADGTCGPAPADAALGGDAAPDGASALCAPDHDGQITLAEMPFQAGRSARYRIATNPTWDSAGASSPNGSRRWDLTGQLANDADRTLALLAPAGQWWSAAFPNASYAAVLSASSELLGVFAIAPTGISLLGVVSPDGGTYRTELEYDPPARMLAAPLAAGATWSSTSTVSGVAQGVIVAYTERYDARADQAGAMVTPYGEFPVMRVATDLARTSGFTTLLTKRTFSWQAECFGPVATAQSQDFEPASEFSDPAEVRRLVP